MKNHNKVILAALIVVTLVAFLALFSLSADEQNPRETTLIGIILTVFSVIATWIASHWYAKQNQEMRIEEIKAANIENLKMFGLKAAEKVMNSSNELTRLSSYLRDTLDKTDEDDTESSLKVLSERIVVQKCHHYGHDKQNCEACSEITQSRSSTAAIN